MEHPATSVVCAGGWSRLSCRCASLTAQVYPASRRCSCPLSCPPCPTRRDERWAQPHVAPEGCAHLMLTVRSMLPKPSVPRFPQLYSVSEPSAEPEANVNLQGATWERTPRDNRVTCSQEGGTPPGTGG